MAGILRFKGSKTEAKLDCLYTNDLFDLTLSPKMAYDMCDVFKNEVNFEKFAYG